MQLHFLGVGEACDGNQPNTSILLKTDVQETAGRFLLDCGFTVPHRYFRLQPDPEELEVVWLSHFHGDHFFGMPLLILWLWEMGREAPLTIVGPVGVEIKIKQAMELAYPNLLSRLGFYLSFIEMAPGTQEKIADTTWQTASNEHSQPCLSLRLECQGHAIFYSGDGRPTPMTSTLARGCDIIVHEAYGLNDTTPGHGSVASCLNFADNAGVKRLVLVHIQRDVRSQSDAIIQSLARNYPGIRILLPANGTRITLNNFW